MNRHNAETRHFRMLTSIGYLLIALLVGGIMYTWLGEWRDMEGLEAKNREIDEFRKEVNNIHIHLIEFSLLGETILEWDDEDLGLYHARRMTMDSMLCRFKAIYPVDPAEHGHIGRLLNTVQVANPGKWEEYFTKWLVGVIANAMNDTGCQNHTCLVLTGDKQGQFKSWWLDNLCPTPLKNYLFTGKIDPQGKDILTLIAEYLFINIDDQLKELNKQNENALKNLITTPAVKYRRPYDVYIEEYPHLASFMASVNGNEFLTDPTGSRRFLPFEVLHIDKPTAESIHMDNVYSEIMYLYRQGVRYWFNDAEIGELHLNNAEFEMQTIEFEMLTQYFEKPTEEEEPQFFMTTAQILARLRDICAMQLSEKRLGEALRKAGFKRVQKRINKQTYSVYGYRIKPVPASCTNNDYG